MESETSNLFSLYSVASQILLPFACAAVLSVPSLLLLYYVFCMYLFKD